jgi:hypothetical protein
MKRITGRNIYITELSVALGNMTPADFARRCKDSKFTAIWIRVGRGPKLFPSFQLPIYPSLRAELDKVGVEVWGWHVPFCANTVAAADEAAKVISWSRNYNLAGVLLDAEKNKGRFEGGSAEAIAYAAPIQAEMAATGRGLALSTHDQPPKHPHMPFKEFLDRVEDNAPQVYYRETDISIRLNKSIAGYKPLEAGRNFKDRYKPVGNITMADDLPMPSVPICLEAAKNFIARCNQEGFPGYSFWCWDTAPKEIWDFFKSTPV